MFSASVRTILQLATPETYYGRVMSLNTITFIGFAPLGSLIIGSIAEPLGIQSATLIGALVVAIAFAWAWIRHPTLRQAA
jgi:predicted MFS family arabinose efflux permease